MAEKPVLVRLEAELWKAVRAAAARRRMPVKAYVTAVLAGAVGAERGDGSRREVPLEGVVEAGRLAVTPTRELLREVVTRPASSDTTF